MQHSFAGNVFVFRPGNPHLDHCYSTLYNFAVAVTIICDLVFVLTLFFICKKNKASDEQVGGLIGLLKALGDFC